MRFFELNDAVAELAAAIASPRPPAEALAHQVKLAWYLRQSNQTQSAALVRDARAQLATMTPLPHAMSVLSARLFLIEAEHQWLDSRFTEATISAQRALAVFEMERDPTGMADAHAILVAIHSSMGSLPHRDAALAEAVAQARLAQDTERVDLLEANQARYAALRDVRLCDAV
jgi:hypothetical protein